MATYTYRAKQGPQKVVQGAIEAATKQEAIGKIDTLGLFPLSVEESKESVKMPTRVALKELVEFTHHLATLVNSGSTLLSALDTLVVETDQQKLKPVIRDIVTHVKEGHDFSQALAAYPTIFPELYKALVKIGETSGALGENLARIAQFLEEEMDFKTNVRSILTYPLIIAGVGMITVFVLLKFVIPKLVTIFEEIGQTLPAITTVLITISRVVSQYWFVLLGVALILFYAGKRALAVPRNRLKWDALKLRLPVVGELLQKIEICQAARTLAILLRNGVPVDTSLRVLTQTVSNRFFRKEMGRLEERIKQGSSLHDAMRQGSVFNPAFINVVTVGEDSGTLEKVLEVLANDYNKEINRMMKNLMSLLEPVLILGVGIIVGFVVLAMLLPIFNIDFNF